MAESPPAPDSAAPCRRAGREVLTTVFLRDRGGERLAMLRRAPWKAFAPNRWTGVGGKVDTASGESVEAGARRELLEETGLVPADLDGWRHLATLDDPGNGVTLAYFTATLLRADLPACTEGTLHWIGSADLPSLDVIDNTRLLLDAWLANAIPAAERGRVVRDAANRAAEIVWAVG